VTPFFIRFVKFVPGFVKRKEGEGLDVLSEKAETHIFDPGFLEFEL
jgi:hypothetical protein